MTLTSTAGIPRRLPAHHLVMKYEGDSEGAAHSTGGYVIGAKHAAPICARERPRGAHSIDQSMHDAHAAAACMPRRERARRLPEELERLSVRVWPPELLRYVRRRTAAMARAIVAHSADACIADVVLRKTRYVGDPSPVVSGCVCPMTASQCLTPHTALPHATRQGDA